MALEISKHLYQVTALTTRIIVEFLTAAKCGYAIILTQEEDFSFENSLYFFIHNTADIAVLQLVFRYLLYTSPLRYSVIYIQKYKLKDEQ